MMTTGSEKASTTITVMTSTGGGAHIPTAHLRDAATLILTMVTRTIIAMATPDLMIAIIIVTIAAPAADLM